MEYPPAFFVYAHTERIFTKVVCIHQADNIRCVDKERDTSPLVGIQQVAFLGQYLHESGVEGFIVDLLVAPLLLNKGAEHLKKIRVVRDDLKKLWYESIYSRRLVSRRSKDG